MIKVITATAGFGKTKSILDAIDLYSYGATKIEKDRSLYITYTKANVQDARKRLKGILDEHLIRTLHSLAYASMYSVNGEYVLAELNAYEFNKMFGRALSVAKGLEPVSALKTRDDYLLSIYNKVRNYNATLDETYLYEDDLLVKDISISEFMQFIEEWEAFKQMKGLIDFVDLLEKTSVLKFRNLFYDSEREKRFDNVRYIFIDEAQDFTPLMWKVVERMAMAINDRLRELVIVGDMDQTIYSYQGAEPVYLATYPSRLANLLDRKLIETQASESKRCPDNIIEYALRFSNKENLKGNGRQGTIKEDATIDDFVETVKQENKSSMVIVRNNKDVNKYIKLLNTMHLPAVSIDKYYQHYFVFKAVQNIIEFKKSEYSEKAYEKLKKTLYTIFKTECKNNYKEAIPEKDVDFAKLYARYSKVEHTINVFKKAYNEISDTLEYLLNVNYPVMVATVHKAKGLEADICYVDMRADTTTYKSIHINEKQASAEKQLLFVAFTRSKHILYVSSDTTQFVNTINELTTHRSQF